MNECQQYFLLFLYWHIVPRGLLPNALAGRTNWEKEEEQEKQQEKGHQRPVKKRDPLFMGQL